MVVFEILRSNDDSLPVVNPQKNIAEKVRASALPNPRRFAKAEKRVRVSDAGLSTYPSESTARATYRALPLFILQTKKH